MTLRADAYFPCCPGSFEHDPLAEYFENLKIGADFAYSGDVEYNDICPKLVVLESLILKDKLSMIVMCEKADQKYFIAGIELDETTKWFIYFNLGSYSKKEDADKVFFAKQDLKVFWSDGYKNAYE